jgi:hypothetical protein
MVQGTAYRLRAFGYELTVRPSPDGAGWLGFAREEQGGKLGPITPITDWPNGLRATKLASCHWAQSYGGASGQSAMDPCEDSLEMWEEVTLPPS